MTLVIRILAALPALMFLGMGIGWLVRPEAIAAQIGMPLLDGIAASSQIGDLGSFFFVSGLLMAVGQFPGWSRLLYVPAGLVCGAAVFRVMAALLGHAALAPQLIAVEVVITLILVVAARRLAR